MAIYTIGDLHLSFNENKPMDIFGENWKNHEKKIENNWMKNVKEEDLVILPGDFSWSMTLKNALEDFKYLNKLPGKKILLKGNHDYWWTTITNMKKFLKDNKIKNIDFLNNNSYEYEKYIIAGTRGWSENENAKDNKKIIDREISRLEMSIKNGIEKYGKEKEIIVFMHYPPINKLEIIENKISNYIRVMKKYNIKKCFYGHLHAQAIKEAVEGTYYEIDFKLVSADTLEFKLLKIK